MKTRYKHRYSALLSLLLCTAGVLLGGCTKQSLSECPNEVAVDVKVVDAEGEDITDQGAIRELSLFVFDKDKLFLKQLNTHIGESLRLYFPDLDVLHVVSWGNLTEQTAQLPSLAVGTPMHEAIIRLKDDPRSQHQATQSTQGKAPATRSIALSPDDLFYSNDEISLKTGAQSLYILKMRRAVAAMSITMRNLQGYTNRFDENYSLVVRETYNAIDFYGRLTGDKVGYVPATTFNDKEELIAPLFNLLPSDAEGMIEIDIYHGDELITTIKNDSEGVPLKAQKGKVLNVLADFHMNVSVTVSITPWGETKIWKEF